jgi:hypothetical protein
MTSRLKQKITDTIDATLPRGDKHTVSFHMSGVRDTVIVRVITSAWKSIPAFLRVFKIQHALQEALTVGEQEQVFRVSVLTNSEYVKQLIARAASKNIEVKRGHTGSPLSVKIPSALKAKGVTRNPGGSAPWIKKKSSAKLSRIPKKS